VKHDCGVLIVHHTPKTNYQNVDSYSWYDWMYHMAGGAALTNWAGAILVIAPSKTPGIYRFIAAKRFEKTQWTEREYWFAHSVENETILWVPASREQIAMAGTSKKAGPEQLLTLIPPIDPISKDQLIQLGKQKLDLGEKLVKRHIAILLEQEKIEERTIPSKTVITDLKIR
jgi:hypothetical protein